MLRSHPSKPDQVRNIERISVEYAATTVDPRLGDQVMICMENLTSVVAVHRLREDGVDGNAAMFGRDSVIVPSTAVLFRIQLLPLPTITRS